MSITRRSIFLTKAWKQGGTGAFKPSTTGILYVPSISAERNVFYSFRERQRKALKFVGALPSNLIPSMSSSGSSGDLRTLPDKSIDYVFVDPPFGGNLMYSELNLVYADRTSSCPSDGRSARSKVGITTAFSQKPTPGSTKLRVRHML